MDIVGLDGYNFNKRQTAWVSVRVYDEDLRT